MTPPNPHEPHDPARLADLAADVLNVVAAIRARAQLTRRRVAHVDALSREHIGADLRQIEDQAQRLAGLVAPLQRTPDPPNAADAAPATSPPEGGPPPARPRPAGRPDRTA